MFVSKEENPALDSRSKERGESFWEGISDHLDKPLRHCYTSAP